MSKIKCFVVDDNHEIREELKSFFASGDFLSGSILPFPVPPVLY